MHKKMFLFFITMVSVIVSCELVKNSSQPAEVHEQEANKETNKNIIAKEEKLNDEPLHSTNDDPETKEKPSINRPHNQQDKPMSQYDGEALDAKVREEAKLFGEDP